MSDDLDTLLGSLERRVAELKGQIARDERALAEARLRAERAEARIAKLRASLPAAGDD